MKLRCIRFLSVAVPYSFLNYILLQYKKLYIAVLSILFSLGMSSADTGSDPAYSGTLEPISGSNLLSFKAKNSALQLPPEQDLNRIWGVEIIKNPFVDDVMRRKFVCEIVGRVFGKNRGELKILACNSGGIELTGYLIRQGYGTEICSETDGMYGTCKKKAN